MPDRPLRGRCVLQRSVGHPHGRADLMITVRATRKTPTHRNATMATIFTIAGPRFTVLPGSQQVNSTNYNDNNGGNNPLGHLREPADENFAAPVTSQARP